ncbi:MAG: FG-GAP repeat domain-containing protein, partial [Gemmatimonadota bacterium]
MRRLPIVLTSGRSRGGLAAALALLGTMAGCDRDQVPLQPAEWHEADGYRWRELAIPEDGRVGFRSLPASRTGVSFANELSEAAMLEREVRSNGSGVAVGDVDGDGLADVYFARLEGPNALYRNLGGWRFEEVTAAAGVGAPDRYSTGVVLADVDGDGDLDLLLTAVGGPTALYENDGSGRFRDVTAEAGLESDRGSTTMALADVEGDGDLDLYVANYKRATVGDLFPPEERALDRIVIRRGDRVEVAPEFREHYEITWRGSRLHRLPIGEPDRLYLNRGDGWFDEVPFEERFLDEEGRPLERAPPD